MNTVLVMLLVPAISILATLNISQRGFADFDPSLAARLFCIWTGLALLFIGLPFRRWCRRRGKNHVGYWLLQWLLVFLPVAILTMLLPVWWAFLVAAILLGTGLTTALVSWCITDCRPFKPRIPT